MESIVDAVQNPDRFVLQTPRLDLRPVEPGDALALHALFSKPGVRKYLLDDAIMPLERVQDEIGSSSAGFARRGSGLWRVGVRADGKIGFAGNGEFHDPPELQLLYGVDPDFRHHGFTRRSRRPPSSHMVSR